MRRFRLGLFLLTVLIFSVANTNSGFAGAYVETVPNSLSQDVFSKLYEQSLGQVVLVRVINKNMTKGTGSGFIWSGDGIILTNAHVVKMAQAVEVYTDDQKYRPAKIVGYDSDFDVAVLKIDVEPGLSVAALDNSDQVKIGDWVYAIGAPYGLKGSLSVGVVGGLHRYVSLGIQEVMQLDLVLNPGNSGGPLYNLRGKVIGMNAMIVREGSIGFAIPINDVIFAAKEILQNGKVKYSELGVGIGELVEIFSEDIAKKVNLAWPLLQKQGVVVISIKAGSPANIAGLQPGDIIVSFNGQQIEEIGKFRRLVALSPSGVPLKMVVKRVGIELTLQVTLVERSAVEDAVEDKEEPNIPTPVPTPAPDSTPAPAPTPIPVPPLIPTPIPTPETVPEKDTLNFGQGLALFPDPVRRSIKEYQGLLSEISIGMDEQMRVRSTNAFAVDSQYVVTVSSFLNQDAYYAYLANYLFNGVQAKLAYVTPRGLAIFKLASPYVSYKTPLIWSDKIKMGEVYYSLVIKNPENGDSLSYIRPLLTQVYQALVFDAVMKKIGLGAPIFNVKGEVVGIWFAQDKDPKDPDDIYDSTIAVPAGLIRKTVETIIERDKEK